MSRDSPGVRIERIAVTSIEQIHADVMRSFERAYFDVAVEDRRARMRRTTSAVFSGLRIDSTECTGGHMRGGAKGVIDIGLVARGGVVATHPKFENFAEAGQIASWAAPGQKLDVKVRPGSRIVSLRLVPERVLQAGRHLVGEEFSIAPAITAPVPDIISRMLYRRTVGAFTEIINLEKTGLSDLVACAFEEALVNVAVSAVRPDLFLSDAPKLDCGRSIGRRAEELLRARAMEPITIASVAEELGVTVRALQLSFRKHRGESPLQFLLDQRMAVARGRLLNPEPRDNVQAIAMACGFFNMSKFASRYRAAFGELPSETLARAGER